MVANKIESLRNQYFQAINLLQDEQDILNVMPEPEYESFFPIMHGIISLIDSSIFELESELEKVPKDDSPMKDYISNELKILQYKKTICNKLLIKGTENKNIETAAAQNFKKNLIFATTESGNIYIEKDLKDLPEEYYYSVEISLKKLQEGYEEVNIKKGKGLKNNAKLMGIHELKPFKVRVFYKNLSLDTVYIMLVRTKKSDNDTLEREEVIKRKKQTISEFERLKELIQDPKLKEELIQENQKIANQIFGFLSRNKR